jgi:hypothetical protein
MNSSFQDVMPAKRSKPLLAFLHKIAPAKKASDNIPIGKKVGEGKALDENER